MLIIGFIFEMTNNLGEKTDNYINEILLQDAIENAGGVTYVKWKDYSYHRWNRFFW